MPRMAADEVKEAALGQEDVALAVVAYVPVLCLLPTLSKSDSDFARSHGRQGVVLFLAEIVACMVAFVPVAGPYLSGASFAILLVASGMGARKALRGEVWKMPFVGAIADQLRALAP